MAKKDKKPKKHQPSEGGVPPRQPFEYMDKYEYEWTGLEWSIKHLGRSWLVILFNRTYGFIDSLYDEFGLLHCWVTIRQFDQQIINCLNYPVMAINPDPLFLRKALDRWIEAQSCRIWCHVYDKLRLDRGIKEVNAAKRAYEISKTYEALYDPTFPIS